MSKYGCPDQLTTNLTTGYALFQFRNGQNKWSEEDFSLAGPYSVSDFQLNTCRLDDLTTEWPNAGHCIFRYAESCPQGKEIIPNLFLLNSEKVI